MHKLLIRLKNIFIQPSPVVVNSTVLIALLVAGNAIFGSWQKAQTVAAIDFFHFWAVAQTVKKGEIKDIYSRDGMREMAVHFASQLSNPDIPDRQKAATKISLQLDKDGLEAVATPFFFTVLGLFEKGDYEHDLRRYVVICLCCYVISILAFCCFFGLPFVPTILLLVLFCSYFTPVASDIHVANVNQLQIAMIALFLWLQRKSFAYSTIISGIVLGAAVMFKPNIAMAAVLISISWFINRHYVKLGMLFLGISCGIALALAAAGVFFGSSACWTQWFHIVHGLLNTARDISQGNIGLAAVIYNAASFNVSTAFVVLLIAIFSFAIWRRRQRSCRKSDTAAKKDNSNPDLFFYETAAAAGLGLAFMLLSARLVWFHYYILIIPLALLLLRSSVTAPDKKVKVNVTGLSAGISLLCFTQFPFLMLPFNIIGQSLIINAGVMILVIIGIYEISRDKASNCLAQDIYLDQAESDNQKFSGRI